MVVVADSFAAVLEKNNGAGVFMPNGLVLRATEGELPELDELDAVKPNGLAEPLDTEVTTADPNNRGLVLPNVTDELVPGGKNVTELLSSVL